MTGANRLGTVVLDPPLLRHPLDFGVCRSRIAQGHGLDSFQQVPCQDGSSYHLAAPQLETAPLGKESPGTRINELVQGNSVTIRGMARCPPQRFDRNGTITNPSNGGWIVPGKTGWIALRGWIDSTAPHGTSLQRRNHQDEL